MGLIMKIDIRVTNQARIIIREGCDYANGPGMKGHGKVISGE